MCVRERGDLVISITVSSVAPSEWVLGSFTFPPWFDLPCNGDDLRAILNRKKTKLFARLRKKMSRYRYGEQHFDMCLIQFLKTGEAVAGL